MKTGKQKRYQTILDEYGDCLTWLEYSQLISAIPKEWWHFACNGLFNEHEDRLDIHQIEKTSKPAQFVYNFIIELNALENIRTYYEKFCKTITGNMDITEFCKLFENLYKNYKRYETERLSVPTITV